MKRKPRYQTLRTLQEEHVFSCEELDLIRQRINEELDQASSDFLRTRGKVSGKHRHADPRRF